MATLTDLFALASQQQEAGNFLQAEQLCRQLLQVDPSLADAWCLRGAACEGQGKLAEAELHCRRALQLMPGHANAHNWLGMIQAQQGRLAEALASFQAAIRSAPDNAEMHHNLGVALAQMGQTAAAVNCYGKALQLRPSFAQAHYNLGLALHKLGQHNAAVEHFQEALRVRPDYAAARNDLANVLAVQGKLDEAVANYRQALEIYPQYAQAHCNLGAALAKQELIDEAIGHFREALRLQPDFADAHNHLGNALHGRVKYEEALSHYEAALRLQPQNPDVRWNRLLVLLVRGDFERAWPEFEWRWTQAGFTRRPFAQPLWDGSPLGGKTILLHAEQGLGDTIHFIRYVPSVKQRGGKVIVECQPALMRILANVPGIDVLLPVGAPLPAFDVHLPMLSLPRVFRTDLATIPAAVPYLAAGEGLVERWRCRLEPLQGLKIGIAWQGNPKNPSDRNRSIPLPFFATLGRVEGVQLICLQKGPGKEQLAALADRCRVHDLGPDFDEASGPFMDTAAVMKNLDLVISADTATAHLAGALAVPVWVALALAADWRWLLQRDDSPWYPTMRLFRQTRFGQWEDVFERMAVELRRILVSTNSSNQPPLKPLHADSALIGSKLEKIVPKEPIPEASRGDGPIPEG